MTPRRVTALTVATLAAAALVFTPTAASAASVSNPGTANCTSYNGYIVQIHSTSRGYLTHRSTGPTSVKVFGLVSDYTFKSNSTGGVQNIWSYKIEATTTSTTTGAIQSFGLGCGL